MIATAAALIRISLGAGCGYVAKSTVRGCAFGVGNQIGGTQFEFERLEVIRILNSSS